MDEKRLENGMATIKVLTASHDESETFMEEHEGVIYKGYGIVHWISAGRQVHFTIHINSGRIIPMFVAPDIDTVKNRIDASEKYVSPDMDYDKINEILKDAYYQMTRV